MDKITFDNFTINIDISDKLHFSTKILFQILFSNVKNKIHIMNFSAVDIDKVINESKSEIKANFKLADADFKDSIVIVEEISKNMLWIEEYAKNLTKDDYLFIIGGERLLTYSNTKPIINTKYFNLRPQVHLMEKENWDKLSIEIDRLYEKMQDNLQGIVINISTDSSSRKLVLKTLEESENMSITCIELQNQNEEYENLQKEIFSKFEDSSLSEILSIIDMKRSMLDKITYNYMITMAHLQHGDVSSTVHLLESNYSDLRNEEKLILSDLLIVNQEKERAQSILFVL